MTMPEKQRSRPRSGPPPPRSGPPPPPKIPLRRLLRVASVACGVQFGWALQLSLLTPYVQELGIPHAWSSIVWLCGPLSGLIVQPLVGHVSDRCASRFGRRRPFIVGGAATIALAVLLIGHSADLGWLLGDQNRGPHSARASAIGVFIVGFWLLDVGNNATQSPCRALLADLTGQDHRRTRIANAYFSLFMALGNVIGYASGSYSGWFSLLPFTVTKACSISCANLKSVFLIDIVLLAITTYISVSSAQEIPFSSGTGLTHSAEGTENPVQEAFLWELTGAVRYLPLPIWIILIVTSLTWIGWFPFVQFDTDWFGREIYRGEPNDGKNYTYGVTMGAFGLMLNSIVLGVTSVVMEKLCRKWGAGFVWGISNLIMALCFIGMLIIAFVASHIEYTSKGLPPVGIIIASLVIFSVLGAPLAVTYSIPYAMISSRIEPIGLGQGLAMGILNLAIVMPQMEDYDIYWPVSSSDSSSMSWTAGSMDWGYESDETNPVDIFAALDHMDQEEVESLIFNETVMTISKTESPFEDSLDEEETQNTGALGERIRKGFTYGGLFWDASWEDDMDLYDDLDDWCCEGDELPTGDYEEGTDDSEDSSSTSGESSGETLPYEE